MDNQHYIEVEGKHWVERVVGMLALQVRVEEDSKVVEAVEEGNTLAERVEVQNVVVVPQGREAEPVVLAHSHLEDNTVGLVDGTPLALDTLVVLGVLQKVDS